jgi:hypothetical protein
MCKMGPVREQKDCQRQHGDKEGKEHTATDLVRHKATIQKQQPGTVLVLGVNAHTCNF